MNDLGLTLIALWGMLLVPGVEAVEVVVLGGLSVTDYSVTSLTPGQIDFEEPASAPCLELRMGHRFTGGISAGLGFGLNTAPLEWRAEGDSAVRSEKVECGFTGLYADWRPVEAFASPYLHLGIGVQWGSLHHRYESGGVETVDDDGMPPAPLLVVGAGAGVEITDAIQAQLEIDRDFVFRNSFAGWQVTDTGDMNGWRFLAGMGVLL